MNQVLTPTQFAEAKQEMEQDRKRAEKTGMKYHSDFQQIEYSMEKIWSKMMDLGKKLNMAQITETASVKQLSTIIAVCGARIDISCFVLSHCRREECLAMIQDMHQKLYGAKVDPPKGGTPFAKIEWFLADWRQETNTQIDAEPTRSKSKKGVKHPDAEPTRSKSKKGVKHPDKQKDRNKSSLSKRGGQQQQEESSGLFV